MANDKEQLRNCYIKTLELQNELYKRDYIVLKIESEIKEFKRENDQIKREKKMAFDANERHTLEIQSLSKNLVEEQKSRNSLKQQLIEQEAVRNKLHEQLEIIRKQMNEKDQQIEDYWERMQSMRIKSRLKKLFGFDN